MPVAGRGPAVPVRRAGRGDVVPAAWGRMGRSAVLTSENVNL
jgi:hypothetical protein